MSTSRWQWARSMTKNHYQIINRFDYICRDAINCGSCAWFIWRSIGLTFLQGSSRVWRRRGESILFQVYLNVADGLPRLINSCRVINNHICYDYKDHFNVWTVRKNILQRSGLYLIYCTDV